MNISTYQNCCINFLKHKYISTHLPRWVYGQSFIEDELPIVVTVTAIVQGTATAILKAGHQWGDATSRPLTTIGMIALMLIMLCDKLHVEVCHFWSIAMLKVDSRSVCKCRPDYSGNILSLLQCYIFNLVVWLQVPYMICTTKMHNFKMKVLVLLSLRYQMGITSHAYTTYFSGQAWGLWWWSKPHSCGSSFLQSQTLCTLSSLLFSWFQGW